MMHKPRREVFKADSGKAGDWDTILASPRGISAEIIVTGEIQIHNRFFLNLRHPHARGIKPEIIKVPVFCLLVFHETFGYFLVDCGLDDSYQKHPHGDIQGLLRRLFWPLKSYQFDGQDIGSQLRARKVWPKGVFLTHLHFDHCSGIKHLANDIPVVVGQNEPYYSCGPLFYQDSFRGIDTIYEIDFTQGRRIRPLGDCVDLLGDGSLWAVSTPGHRPGHVSYLINGFEKVLLYTGDACDIELGFECVVGPGFGSHNIKVAQRSLQQLVDFKNRYAHVNMVFGHEF